ncbi:MAG: hypothetical protein HS115_11595 [Spirochaetales bacterium]|nr:hypothetical protein [Spirochaetales bacterium]
MSAKTKTSTRRKIESRTPVKSTRSRRPLASREIVASASARNLTPEPDVILYSPFRRFLMWLGL